MKELCFESKLTMEEVQRNFEDIDFFEGIMTGLGEALAYEKGKARAQTLFFGAQELLYYQ